jgi:putative acetyltransferase
LSLVATEGNRPVGHILFSPAAIFPDPPAAYPGADTDHPALPRGLALGPMAVLPARQRRGIGSALVRRGLSLARATGAAFVIVLGHPGFYPRFGFQPAAPLGIRCQWEGVPEEAFMIRVLDSRAMAEVTGTARYREEFDAAV